MSDRALEQRRRNIAAAVRAGKLKRLRSDCESRAIKLFTWQSRYESGPRPSERALARQLRVWPSYVHKLLEKAHSEGMDALLERGERVALDDLAEARRSTAKLREEKPTILAPATKPAASVEPRAMTADECIAETWRSVGGRRWFARRPERRVLSVPVR